ncbi:hypothetical protein Pla110_30670 [Polystyrenella longa]|uniref:Sulfatase n=1 Tax=Polystyrenella longa TaxID=2528007 RepID=A0A518CQ30_9PLAN|nr:DUF1501 domain-containing protein [Polystyrenella longa]QDU81326.1 hypothetical protein Pla110_30670 [Polystyrenella longa]
MRRCRGPINRRDFMRVGSLALGGLVLPQILQAKEASGTLKQRKSVIFLFQHGGASQLETYDLKPDAPLDYRSCFSPISTNVPGMDLCEHLPLHAKIADKFSLVRSMHHDVDIHSDGGITVLTGKRPEKLDPTSQSKSEHPCLGAVASHVLGTNESFMPPYVSIPNKIYMVRPAYLGVKHSPFASGNPAADSYAPPHLSLPANMSREEFKLRGDLVKHLDRLRTDIDSTQNLQGTEEFRELALQMLTSPQTAQAFDLQRETVQTHTAYGHHEWGQSCLLARRLAEAGTLVTTIYLNSPMSGNKYTNWDDHILNAGQPGHFAEYMERRLPFMDQAVSALVQDIFDRGLQEEIMVVAVGEFGRTPKLSHNSSGTGRNHWPGAYTAFISGGGLKMGQVVGATNSKAEYPTQAPYSPQDLLATIYRHLGINWNENLIDHSGRPVPILPTARPIAELI